MGTANTEQFGESATGTDSSASGTEAASGRTERLFARFFRALAPPDEWLAAQQE